MGQFYYAAKAFDALEKLDPGSNYWEGKRGACVGIFQLILANKEPKYVPFLTVSNSLSLYGEETFNNLCHHTLKKNLHLYNNSEVCGNTNVM